METIGTTTLRTFLSSGWSDEPVTNNRIRRDKGHPVTSYDQLVRCVAKLSFYNREHVLLFRGQSKLYRATNGKTSLQPSIFRDYPSPEWSLELARRYKQLERADRMLIRGWETHGLDEFEKIARQKILRWAILQHYQVCRTPLLDLTQSLRVAASFASFGQSDSDGFLYVLGVPQLSGAITASAEAGLQIVRLSSICPPSALRPHFQEGYLITEYPELPTVDEKRRYHLYEIDCSRRLLATFRLKLNDGFRLDENFPPLTRSALYPDSKEDDKLAALIEEIRRQLKRGTKHVRS